MPAITDYSDELALWLMRPRTTRITGARCVQKRPAGPDDARRYERCGRPQWGDGSGAGGMGEGLCSRCWHEHAAFHSPYTTMQANPAASQLSGQSIVRRSDIFGRKGNALPFTFPLDWL